MKHSYIKLSISVFLTLCGLLSGVQSISAQESANKNTCVVLLHGMGRTANSMDKISASLEAAGYVVWNEGYPSLSASIEELSEKSIQSALDLCCQSDLNIEKMHFVTHSLGGILLRYYLQDAEIQKLDKVVMLSPPNHGSEVVDTYRNNWLFRLLTGPAFLQLGTDGLVNELEPIPGTIGVITGNESSDPWFSGAIPGEDDGKVSVESAKLDEMKDFLVVPEGHTFIMQDEKVIQQIHHFLHRGQFDHPE